MSVIDSSASYPTQPDVNKGCLPDPFSPPGSSRVSSAAEWPQAASVWRELIVETLFGKLPLPPESIRIETLNHSLVSRLRDKPRSFIYRVHCQHEGRSLCFSVRILTPPNDGPHPAVVNGDGCWWYVTDEIIQTVLDAGCAFVTFNRTEFAEDVGSAYDSWKHTMLPKGQMPDLERSIRQGGLYELYNDTRFGAISAWAWGYHRCVDLLHQLPYIDCARIAVSGHSRGAKAALLAGLLDARIAMVNDNASCAAGSPLFRYVGNQGETLGIIRGKFPTWFQPGLLAFAGREEALPFDQHCLLACLAPRPVLLTFSVDDRWSNPEGMVLSANAARPVYELFDAGEHLAFCLRNGPHQHSLEDWVVLMNFIRWKWFNETPKGPFNQHPYSHLPSLAVE